ncbi:MAG: calcium/sodium antiporter [Inquilinus sp.]|nr:calcium/sodium antiporter [Inquilinus sp.]
MTVPIIMTVGGLVLLMVGADFLVRGAVGAARCMGISPLVIGLTVVALGTSLPELVVSLEAALDGTPQLAVGNIVGSNIANILLILGVAGLISPIRCSRMAIFRDGTAMMAATAIFVAAGLLGTLGRAFGALSLFLLASYMVLSYYSDRGSGDGVHAEEADEIEPIAGGLGTSVVAVIGGLTGVILGAELLVDGAVGLARAFNVSEEVIGLTLVAFGTSVPELATTVVAAIRRHADVALGNVLGSNLFNLMGVMGVVAIVVPVDLPAQIARFDIWVMSGVSVLMIQFMYTGLRLSRLEALLFLAAYFVFLLIEFIGVDRLV